MKTKTVFKFTNADLKNYNFLSLQVRVNKEIIFNLSHASYKSKGEAIKKVFTTFELHLHESLQKKKENIEDIDTETSLSETGHFSLIPLDNPTMSEGRICKNVDVLK